MKKILILALASLLLIPAAGAQQAQKKINKKNLVIKEWNSDPKGGIGKYLQERDFVGKVLGVDAVHEFD